MEFLRGEVEYATKEAKGRGVQASFKIFRQFTLQLHLDFNMKVLEALVTPVVVDRAIDKVEEVAAL